MIVRLAVFSFLCAVLLSACGQKGALYLPDDAMAKPPMVKPAAPAADSTPTK